MSEEKIKFYNNLDHNTRISPQEEMKRMLENRE